MMMKKTVGLAVAAGALCAFGGRKVSFECDTLDLGEYREYAKIAKELGATHLAACQIEPSMWQWNRNRYDPYPNWSMHRPTIFKFVVRELRKKVEIMENHRRDVNRLYNIYNK